MLENKLNSESYGLINSLWWPSLPKGMQTKQLLCWSGMTDTEHSTTCSSNEEE